MSHEKVLQLLKMKDSAPWEFDARSAALLVIDMQRYFVRPEYAFGKTLEGMVPGITRDYFDSVAEVVVPNIRRLQAACRAQGIPIFFTGTGTRRPDRSDLPGWLRAFDAAGDMVIGSPVWPSTEEAAWQVDENVGMQAGDVLVNKTSAGALTTTDLHGQFEAQGIRTLLFTGTSTDVCVTTTARDAADLGYEVVVIEDACTTLSREMHEQSLNAIRLAFGRTRSTEAMLALLKAKAGTASVYR